METNYNNYWCWLSDRTKPIKTEANGWFVFLFLSIAILFTFGLGALLHSVYEWSGQNRFVGYFTPTSESVWEHLKLIFYPFLITAGLSYFIVRDYTTNFSYALLISIIFSGLFMLQWFYLLEAGFGVKGIIFDILLYFVTVIFGVLLFYLVTQLTPTRNYLKIFVWVGLIALFLVFCSFSFVHPDLPIFNQNIST